MSPELPPHVPSWELPQHQAPAPLPQPDEQGYLPLSQTLRLYAGWLLAWYGLVYLMGSLQQGGLVPWAPEFIGNLYRSPLTLHFTFATYIFLLCGTVHRGMGGGVLKAVLLTLAGIILFWGFWTYA